MSSDQAKELKLQLKLQINVQSSAHKENSIPTDNISANIRQLLDEIGLIITCIQSTDNDASCKDDPRVLQQVPDQVPQRSDSDEPCNCIVSSIIYFITINYFLCSTVTTFLGHIKTASSRLTKIYWHSSIAVLYGRGRISCSNLLH